MPRADPRPPSAARCSALVAAWLLAAATAGPARAAPRPTAPVLVTLVVDQLAAWVVDERIGLLPPTGGFARLLREGARVRDLRYAHATTDTAPGHASLYTGALPRSHGITSNETPPRPECHPGTSARRFGERDSVLLDPDARTLPAPAGAAPCGVSLRRLRVETLADGLRAAHPDAVILSFSLKDRGAAFGGGRRPTASVWLDGSGRFVTSTAFAHAAPAWLDAINRDLAARVAAGADWTLEDEPWVRAHARTPDAQAGESVAFDADPATGRPGLGNVFPHPVRTLRAWRATPGGDELLLRAALAAADAERAGATRPLLLAISLSSNDAVGHLFGPDSWEAWDELHRLDTQLGRFFAALDQRFGEQGWSVLLSADHGVGHMPAACAGAAPDRWGRPCKGDGARVFVDVPPRPTPLPAGAVDLPARLEQAALAARGGKASWVAHFVDPYLYLDTEGRRHENRAALLSVLAARPIPGIARFFDVAALPAACPALTDESEEALLCRAIAPGAGGDLYVVPAPGSVFDPLYDRGHGMSHGSPALHDRAVPLLVRAPGRVRPGLVEGPLPFATFVRTAASLLGIAAPAAALPAPDLTAGTDARR